MKKINEAIAKITKECEGKNYLISFEEYLTSICTTEKVADKILKEDKTLQGAFDKMKNIASERKEGNFAYISPDEGFGIIDDYYGITDADKKKSESTLVDIADFL